MATPHLHVFLRWKGHWRIVDDAENIQMRACSAVLTKNFREIKTIIDAEVDQLPEDLSLALLCSLKDAPIPGEHSLVKFTMYLPAWMQYIGQRAILLFPRLAFRLLRSSGLHHQMY